MQAAAVQSARRCRCRTRRPRTKSPTVVRLTATTSSTRRVRPATTRTGRSVDAWRALWSARPTTSLPKSFRNQVSLSFAHLHICTGVHYIHTCTCVQYIHTCAQVVLMHFACEQERAKLLDRYSLNSVERRATEEFVRFWW